jgi:hypothetical protein
MAGSCGRAGCLPLSGCTAGSITSRGVGAGAGLAGGRHEPRCSASWVVNESFFTAVGGSSSTDPAARRRLQPA